LSLRRVTMAARYYVEISGHSEPPIFVAPEDTGKSSSSIFYRLFGTLCTNVRHPFPGPL